MPEKKKSVVPPLRFPEFRDAGEWEVKQLKHISPAIFDGTHQTPNYTEKGVPFFSVENIVSGNENKYISREDYIIATVKNKPEKGDILITRIGNIGFSKVVDWDYEFSIYVTLAVVKKSELFNSQYLHCYFQSEYYQKEILSKSLLSAIPCKINMDELQKTKVLLPSLPEQQKIADCLSSLDEVIDLEAQKLEALKAHKKGLMQQLFPREGETIPSLRFPEFRDAGEWEVKRLGDEELATFVAETADRDELDIETYISTENLLPDFGGVSRASKLPATGTFKKYRYGDILLANIRPYLRKAWLATFGGAASNDVIIIRPSLSVNSLFIMNNIRSDRFISYVMEGAKGVKMPRGDISLMKQYPVATPSLPEQQKIADCLSSLDEVIDLQTQKLDALKAHKKGLMQQLFPSEVD